MNDNQEVQAVPVAAFIQARMSSSRFPGKVLAPFQGTPIIRQVVERVRTVPEIASVVVATSEAVCDDPLVAYLESLEVPVFRGPLEDVFGRFSQCWKAHPCEWVLRICADSPLVNPAVLQSVIRESESDKYDIVTTRHPCTFPKGWNADLVRASAFFSIQSDELTDHDIHGPSSC